MSVVGVVLREDSQQILVTKDRDKVQHLYVDDIVSCHLRLLVVSVVILLY